MSSRQDEATEFKARVEATRAKFMRACSERGCLITADERVSEETAANLIGYSAGSLKNLRALGSAPKHYRRGAGRGDRVSYRLEDLAIWIEEAREDW